MHCIGGNKRDFIIIIYNYFLALKQVLKRKNKNTHRNFGVDYESKVIGNKNREINAYYEKRARSF